MVASGTSTVRRSDDLTAPSLPFCARIPKKYCFEYVPPVIRAPPPAEQKQVGIDPDSLDVIKPV